MRSISQVLSYLILLHATSTEAIATNTSFLPVVDLGYEIHKALSYNATSDVYRFSNIRYARAPTGDLRFRAPQPPLVDRSSTQDGAMYRACPQGVPRWQANAYIPIAKWTAAATFSLEGWEHDIANSRPPPGFLETMNDNTSEDCLFLDVHTPRRTFQRAASKGKDYQGAPVIVWIHGGGYILGSKTGHPTPNANPDGLIRKARDLTPEGVVFVALNYRLGALGFLASPEVAVDGALNAGLLDQRLALEWIQKNIHRFGGDPKRVTVMGESAGGGSILYQMAAYGGHNGSAPFSQAIVQSPASLPRGPPTHGSYSGFLTALGATSLAEARKKTEKEVISANQLQVGAAPATTYIFGPVVDGLVVPDEIGSTFYSGAFDRNVRLMAAHNSFEGGFFYDPNVTTEADFRSWTLDSVAGLSEQDAEYLAKHLYPPIFDGSVGYVDQATRQMAFFGDAIIECTFLLANEALKGNTVAYEFSVPPGIHIQDLKYTFDDYTTVTPAPKAKEALQHLITTFATGGVPKLDGFSGSTGPGPVPHWGKEQALVNITSQGAEMSTSRVNGTRCDWWHKRGHGRISGN